jgi:hypothetical protein
MKPAVIIIVGLALIAAGMQAGEIQDIELVSSVTTSTPVTVTAKPRVSGLILSFGVDVASASTGAVILAVSPVQSMLARQVANTNPLTADIWIDPSDSGSRPYAFTAEDTLSLTITNLAVATKTYRAVIRIEKQ